MTEQQFLRELELALTKLPTEERNDILSDIKEYFRNGREDGKTESDIAVSLGSPKEIAQEILESHVPEKIETTNKMIHVPHSNFSNVMMDIDYGSLNVFPSETDETFIELIGENEKLELTADVVNDTLSIQLKTKKFNFFSFLFLIKEMKVNVALPKKLYSSIVMKTDNGRIRAEKILGKTIKVTSDNGSIGLKEFASTVLDVETDNGRIDLEKIQVDKLSTQTDNGRIELRNIDAIQIRAKTDNGRIMMEYVNGNITGKTDNGRISLLTTTLNRMIDLETDNGSILVEAENEPTNVTIQAKTDFGGINILGEKNSRTVIGLGTNKVKLSSDNGKITVITKSRAMN
ncbi:DUF4097 family beta strand repeat-containing protein [Psychrobacillus sp. FJAT-21963]|uniref:DUF4097 family beta strand repeat-containing protein n=1 Tax=Psychrobacillus sp. FJAT-21963 TaxID=1712028 RepID=UPI0006FDCBEA|nr:DUF4097 family beta strand repeat-containing protein [Psychrobacillus sp. FJAT-21963]KQL35068.1 hypothetical protein AN959_12075 [Psychrobacillus sp. FJAT-21963]